MKNPTSGDLSVMLNSVTAAQHPHHFIYRGNDVETSGNDLAHTILRGGVNQYGQTIPNYHYEDLIHLSALYAKKDLKNPAIIIDASSPAYLSILLVLPQKNLLPIDYLRKDCEEEYVLCLRLPAES